jgi:hypothetical protein
VGRAGGSRVATDRGWWSRPAKVRGFRGWVAVEHSMADDLKGMVGDQGWPDGGGENDRGGAKAARGAAGARRRVTPVGRVGGRARLARLGRAGKRDATVCGWTSGGEVAAGRGRWWRTAVAVGRWTKEEQGLGGGGGE